jgi:ABC-2 type transport system ATP-binding protein
LLLDEPTRSLDPISAVGLRRALADWARGAAERTVLITTHNLAEVELLCERVAILSRGRVIECATLEALRSKYARDEQVELRVRGAVDDAALSRLRELLGTVEYAAHDDGTSSLRIARRARDERLQLLLSGALERGLTVLDCETQHFGLMQVLESVEEQAKGS